ncbi:hypothetical protein H8959_007353 [Pygathrix nigripes]
MLAPKLRIPTNAKASNADYAGSMSFTICFTTSTNYQSLHSIQPHSHIIWSISSAGEVYAGLRGLDSRTSIDNAGLAADDFRVKYKTELAMCQSVESNVHGLHKVIDDTNVSRLQLETEMALKEELLFMQKNQEKEVKGLHALIASSGLTKEKTEEHTTVVTTQSTKIGAAEMTFMELRCIVQSLEINLDSMRNLKASLENSLREVEACYAMHMEQLSGALLHLDSELAQAQTEGQCQAQKYEALLNIKVKLEAEIATYCCLLGDGEDFSCSDACPGQQQLYANHPKDCPG